MKNFIPQLLVVGLVCYGFVVSGQSYLVDPEAPDNAAADGTAANPFNDIAVAVQFASDEGGGEVLILPGEYTMTKIVSIETAAAANGPVIIKPMDGGNVKFNCDLRAAFEFTETSRYITLEGIELDGNTDKLDYWDIRHQSLLGG